MSTPYLKNWYAVLCRIFIEIKQHKELLISEHIVHLYFVIVFRQRKKIVKRVKTSFVSPFISKQINHQSSNVIFENLLVFRKLRIF